MHGYAVATTVAMVILVLAAVIAFLMINHRPAPGEAEGHPAAAETTAPAATEGADADADVLAAQRQNSLRSES